MKIFGKMMRALIVVFCILASLNLQADSKDIYIVVSSTFTPHNDISYNDANRSRRTDEKIIAYVACYLIKYQEENFSEEMVKKTFNDYIQDKDKGTVVHNIDVSTFEDRKEAKDYYDALTKSKKRKQARRIPFTKSHLDRAHRKLVIEMREREKEREEEEKKKALENPPVVTPPVSKPMANRAIDDIYD